jgi:hypothetical protein
MTHIPCHNNHEFLLWMDMDDLAHLGSGMPSQNSTPTHHGHPQVLVATIRWASRLHSFFYSTTKFDPAPALNLDPIWTLRLHLISTSRLLSMPTRFDHLNSDASSAETRLLTSIVLERRVCGAANKYARDIERERERETRSQEGKGSTMTTFVSGATIRCICRLGCML